MTDLLEPPVVMGVLNVTPDSFSDGGRYADLDAAVAHGVALRAEGAQIVDVGGESTRPGADRVDPATELARVLPVIRELAAEGIPMSIDTTRASVAAAALEAGVWMVNDVSGGLADRDMARVVAEAGCPWVLMHWRGHSRDMRQLAHYGDVVPEVIAELMARVDDAVRAGVPAEKLIIDPGLGFAKRPEHNWALSARLPELVALGFPVLFAASRKSYLGALLAGPDGAPRPPGEREAATLATGVLAVAAGAWGVRVHDVRATVDALAVWRATGAPRLPAAPGVTVPGRAHRGPAGTGTAGGRRDQISLTGLRVRGRHGVYDSERVDGQDFVVDAVLELALGPAAASDDVALTVDYGDLAQRLAAEVAGDPVCLIETLAERLAVTCLRDARVAAATVTVHKPQAPIPLDFVDVAVTITRTRAGTAGTTASAGTGPVPRS